MKRVPIFLALTLALAAAGAAAAQPTEEAQRREYTFQNLDATVAEALFWELCGAETPDRCRVLHATGQTLHVIAPPAVQRRMAGLVAERDAQPPSFQLQVHLLSASRAPGEPPAALSAAARQALADLTSVLGYRRFELLDSGAVETVRNAQVNLMGPAGTRVKIVLELRDVSGLDDEKLVVQVGAVSEGNSRSDLPEEAPDIPASNLLQTSLALDLGETAVVGTTRLAGADEALVLLLTAVR